MSHANEDFQDSTGLIWIPIGLVTLLAMPALTALVGWYQVLFVY